MPAYKIIIKKEVLKRKDYFGGVFVFWKEPQDIVVPMKPDPGDSCQLGKSPGPTRNSHIRKTPSSAILLNFSPTCVSRDEDLPAKANQSLGTNAMDSFRL